ncbi:MAG: hypothetical protein O7C67_11780 [Gammaproteobacteria bacterium]|nr:hypothetical protein [Gammaproteobacteria bacterium]
MQTRLLTLMFVALPAQATQVFVTLGEFGEVSYSDEASGGATVIELTTREPDPDDLARAAANLESTWAVAREMEASRLAREAAVAARRMRNESEPRPQSAYLAPEPRVIVGYGRPYRRHYRQHNHRQDHLWDHPHQQKRMAERPETVTLRKPLRRDRR